MAERQDIQPDKPTPSGGGTKSSSQKKADPAVRNAGNIGSNGKAGVDTSGGKPGSTGK